MKLEAFVSPLHIYAVYLSKKPVIFVFLHLNFDSEDVRKNIYMNMNYNICIYINTHTHELKPPIFMHFYHFGGEIILCIIVYHDLDALLRLKKLLVPIPICLVHLLCT